jgi:hypothetical protein
MRQNPQPPREPDEPDGVEVFRLRWKNCEAAEDIWRTRKQLGEAAESLLAAFRELWTAVHIDGALHTASDVL